MKTETKQILSFTLTVVSGILIVAILLLVCDYILTDYSFKERVGFVVPMTISIFAITGLMCGFIHHLFEKAFKINEE